MGRIVITGSTRGIGRALAERFIEAGWVVVINGRSTASVSGTVTELSAGRPGADCLGLAGDVSDPEDMRRLWEAASADGPVDVWINNAGVDQSRAMTWELDHRELISLIATNLIGSFTGSAIAARGMMIQGHGVIYQMEGFGSDGMTQPGLAAYGASKSAVRYLAKALATELKSANSPVRSGTISPGMVTTELLLSGIPEDPGQRARFLKIVSILADTPERVSGYIAGRIIRGAPKKIRWLTGAKAGWRFATAFARTGRLSEKISRS